MKNDSSLKFGIGWEGMQNNLDIIVGFLLWRQCLNLALFPWTGRITFKTA